MKKGKKIVRATKHHLTPTNKGKLEKLDEFLTEYQRVGQAIIDIIWEHGYGEFNVKTDKLDFPKYLDYNSFNVTTELSARAMSSLTTQVAGVISAATEKRRRVLWAISNTIKKGESPQHLLKKLEKPQFVCVKPDFAKGAELSSKCLDIRVVEGRFGLFIRLKSLGKLYGFIRLPIQLTKRNKHWVDKGYEMAGSFLVKSNRIDVRYQKISKPKDSGAIVGMDQGLKTVLTLSNEQTTPDSDAHGHSLDSVCSKVARKRKGSKAFAKAQAHRKNFINWSVNQLNLDGIKEIRLEKVTNINFGRRASRKMQAWTNTEIRDKLMRYAEEHEVHVVLQDSTYRSQRCSCCGNVRKANRKGKVYSCKRCGNTMDADLNAAKNHEINLPKLPFDLRSHRLNLKDGFLWTQEGIKSIDGSELRVPISSKQG